ncbi:hypothetical protein RS85_02196 [Microbacterium sp. SA39]|nr:hypothetical protein RS85_02196 [Microbacterium sp. SA39]
MLAGAVGLSVLAGVAVLPSAQLTEARFTDPDYASSTTFTAGALATPVITACTVANNVLGVFQSVTITWTSPYVAANVRLTATSGTTTGTIPAANITATGPVGGLYTYTANVPQSLLASLISNLLGSTTTLSVTNVLPGTNWVSPAATRRLSIALLGLNASCTV